MVQSGGNDQARLQAAEQSKEQANSAFREKNYDQAITHFKSALEQLQACNQQVDDV